MGRCPRKVIMQSGGSSELKFMEGAARCRLIRDSINKQLMLTKFTEDELARFAGKLNYILLKKDGSLTLLPANLPSFDFSTLTPEDRLLHPLHVVRTKSGSSLMLNPSNASSVITYEDKHFYRTMFVSANLIHDNYVALSGPKNDVHLELFFRGLFFNSRLSKPVTHIICLGDNISDEKHHSFVNYFTSIGALTRQNFKKFIVTTNCQQDKEAFHYIDGKYHQLIEAKLGLFHEGVPSINVNVHAIVMPDMEPLKLRSDALKKMFWDVFQDMKKGELTAVHCASGLGRTGQVLLTFEILKHYDEIYHSNKTKAEQNQMILGLLEELRKSRPGLVLTERQYTGAAKNAQSIYNYGMSLGKKWWHLSFMQKKPAEKKEISLSKSYGKAI